MFWDQGAFDMEAVDDYCRRAWGVLPDRDWAEHTFGGLEIAEHASNIVFTSGEYDPWSSGEEQRWPMADEKGSE